MPRWWQQAGAVAALLAAGAVQAYNVFPYGSGEALKWGASNQVGTPGGVVTWSLMPDGTPLDPLVSGLGFSGTSNLSSVFAQVGGSAAAMPWIQAAFSAWSAVANVQFVQVTESGSLPFGAAYGGLPVVGSIRIGAFAFAPGDTTAAVGYAAPPNGGTTLEGDILFNTSNLFRIAPGQEGDLYELYPASSGFFYTNDLPGLFAHELGHALGMAHSAVGNSLMCGYVNAGADGSQCGWWDADGDGKAPILRLPKLDDIAGIQFLYGPSPVPEPSGWMTLLVGLGLLGFRLRRPAPAIQG